MKSKFLSELDCRLKNDKIWVLDYPLVYASKLLNDLIVVPMGFETDFASVPRVPIAYWFWGGRAHREAIIHDALYRSDSIPLVSKKTADSVFLEAMKSRKKSKFVRWPMYLGVKFFGGNCYHKRKMMDKL